MRQNDHSGRMSFSPRHTNQGSLGEISRALELTMYFLPGASPARIRLLSSSTGVQCLEPGKPRKDAFAASPHTFLIRHYASLSCLFAQS